MGRKRSIAFAALASGVLVASSAAFALANGIFRNPSADQVGTFRAVEQLLPAETSPSRPTATAPPGPGPDETTTSAPGAGAWGGKGPTSYDRTPDTTAARSEEPPRVVPPTSTTTTTTSTASTVPKKDDDGDEPDHPDKGAGDDD